MDAFFLAESTSGSWSGHYSALAGVLLGTAALMAGIAIMGRWLASTHTGDEPAGPRAPSASQLPAAPHSIEPAVMAAITAAVSTVLGARAAVTSVALLQPKVPSIDGLMMAWSVEGRRQIYSSHKIR